ncbi:unnamed protein product [Haemonchus placei]|uniref:Peptidase M16 middle/third domain-containing protein n=1 Tax=Haemonchus placei TaxID=6290 RepID=A0A3P7T1C0_HAEPC|nr:unnamed protein product [Haemonchus placei]
MSVTAPIIAADPRSTMLSSMFLWCLNDALTEETYNAELAGLKCELELGTFGTNLKVTGYDEKQPLFVEHLVKRMTDFKPGLLKVCY